MFDEASMSCEPNRTKAYSEDLRWRMVYQVEMRGKSSREVGESLAVDQSTVCRIVALSNTSGNAHRRIPPSNSDTAVLTEIDKIIILETNLQFFCVRFSKY